MWFSGFNLVWVELIHSFRAVPGFCRRRGSKRGRPRPHPRVRGRRAGASLLISWRRPTLPPVKAVPWALRGLTTLFGMGRGEHPGYSHHYWCGWLVFVSTTTKTLTQVTGKKKVSEAWFAEALESLVRLSSTISSLRPGAYQRGRLPRLLILGDLIFR